MKTLLATESVKVNDYYAIQLVEEGIEPSKAENAELINEIIESKGIDVLILDIDSENFKGLDTVKETKTKFENLNVIVMTTKSGVDFVKEMGALGVFGILSKMDDMHTQFKNIISLIDNLKIRKNELRKHLRVKPAPAQHNRFSLSIPGLGSTYQGQIKDISKGGVALTFSKPPSESLLFKGKEITISIELEAMNLNVKGVVVLRNGMNAAIRFHNISDGYKRRLFEYILKRIES